MRLFAPSLLCVLGLTVLLHAQSTEPATQPKDDASTTLVKRGDISTTLEFDGHFEPTEVFEVRVRPKAYQGDLLIESAATPGARVKQGERLLAVDATQIRKQLAAAENELTAAQANLVKAEADVHLGEAADQLALKMQQTELSNAEAGLKWWEDVDGAHLLKSAELAVKSARDNVEDQTDELEQLRKMYKSEELTSETADIVVKRALRSAERAKITQGMQEAKETKVRAFDYSVARQKLVFGIEQQKQQLDALMARQQQQSIIRRTAMVSAQVAADKAQTKADELTEDLAGFEVNAPFDGVVYGGEFNQGRWPNVHPKSLRKNEKLAASQVVLTVVPAGELRLVLDVPEAKLQFIEPGMRLRVIPLAVPDARTTGSAAAPASSGVIRENNLVYPMFVALSDVDPRLAPGQKGIARIDVEAKDVLVVPASAISKGRVKVRMPDGRTLWRDVVSGYSDGELTEIRQGLEEGDEVVTKVAGK
jgi:HlyD family secretion protein